jgi:hypothetical protein
MSRVAPALRRTQELFWTLITAPQGVRSALEGPVGRLDPREVERTFVGDDRMPAIDRLDIYANMYFFRLLECLAEDFPRVRAAVGGARFHNLATDYLLAHPSSHPSLRFLGRALPEFLAHHSLRREFPYLADLARLDWARVDVFDRRDATPLDREGLARLPQDRAGEARFSLVPALEVLRLEHDVLPIWRELQQVRERGAAGADAAVATSACASSTDSRSPEVPGDGEEDQPLGPPQAPRRPTIVQVWRSGFTVYHRALDPERALCLERLAGGESLAAICQALGAGRSLEAAVGRVGGILQGFIEDGLLAGWTLPEVS